MSNLKLDAWLKRYWYCESNYHRQGAWSEEPNTIKRLR